LTTDNKSKQEKKKKKKKKNKKKGIAAKKEPSMAEGSEQTWPRRALLCGAYDFLFFI
jgi:hypothetical protein